ncbi:hypothetical protein RB195_001012 [Necator americanus]|uniref:Uncharacterized protein n=1 Tax=Necator americanus TaxID=51031 RepID=A0ABR1DCA1_NECAM
MEAAMAARVVHLLVGNGTTRTPEGVRDEERQGPMIAVRAVADCCTFALLVAGRSCCIPITFETFNRSIFQLPHHENAFFRIFSSAPRTLKDNFLFSLA